MDLMIIKYSAIVGITLILTIIATRITKKLLEKSVDKLSDVMKMQQTNYTFFRFLINFAIYSIALVVIFYSVPELRSIGITILASAGVLTAIIGFAAQEAFSNIISGIFIFIFKPFHVGDQIKVGDLSTGIVEDITLRHTIIKNFENKRIIFPNSQISSSVIVNSSIIDEKICNFIEFGISYDSNIDMAVEIIKSVAMKHKFFIDNRTEDEKQNNVDAVITRVISLGDFSVNIRAYVWSRNIQEGFILKTDLFKSVKEEFDKNNIEIPFPYRTIVHKDK